MGQQPNGVEWVIDLASVSIPPPYRETNDICCATVSEWVLSENDQRRDPIELIDFVVCIVQWPILCGIACVALYLALENKGGICMTSWKVG